MYRVVNRAGLFGSSSGQVRVEFGPGSGLTSIYIFITTGLLFFMQLYNREWLLIKGGLVTMKLVILLHLTKRDIC